MKYLIWSNKHSAWWGPECAGYYQELSSAGVYTELEAARICRRLPGTTPEYREDGAPLSVMVPAPDMAIFHQERALRELLKMAAITETNRRWKDPST